MLVVPDTWDNLESYTTWYKENNYPIRPPSNMFVYETEVALSIVVFRQDVYQTEMYFAKPNMVAHAHSHTADQMTIFGGGSYTASFGFAAKTYGSKKFGEPQGENQNLDLPHQEFGAISTKLTAGFWHSLSAGSRGFMFFVCQKWNDKQHMNSTFIDWVGKPLGETHKELINSFEIVQ
jgi:hypothetical protein